MEEENKFIVTLKKHWTKFIFGMLAVAIVAVWSERYLASKHSKDRQDFFVVQKIFERFQKGETIASEVLETVENILSRHPELYPKYDAMLAMSYFSQSKIPEARQHAESLLKQSDTLSAFYQSFAQTTLLIEEGNFSEALERSLDLHKKLLPETTYQTLDVLNTLRLVFLADKLEQCEQKKIFWRELEKHPLYPSIQELFHEGSATLEAYFEEPSPKGLP